MSLEFFPFFAFTPALVGCWLLSHTPMPKCRLYMIKDPPLLARAHIPSTLFRSWPSSCCIFHLPGSRLRPGIPAASCYGFSPSAGPPVPQRTRSQTHHACLTLLPQQKLGVTSPLPPAQYIKSASSSVDCSFPIDAVPVSHSPLPLQHCQAHFPFLLEEYLSQVFLQALPWTPCRICSWGSPASLSLSHSAITTVTDLLCSVPGRVLDSSLTCPGILRMNTNLHFQTRMLKLRGNTWIQIQVCAPAMES